MSVVTATDLCCSLAAGRTKTVTVSRTGPVRQSRGEPAARPGRSLSQILCLLCGDPARRQHKI